jgi:hypothetical protein
MSEIEKMYENCNFEKSMGVGSPLALHPFTAEKQLSLFQWICKKFEEIYISYTDFGEVKNWEIVYKISIHRNSFEECLCAFINLFWQSLTPEEKQQVKGILE